MWDHKRTLVGPRLNAGLPTVSFASIQSQAYLIGVMLPAYCFFGGRIVMFHPVDLPLEAFD